MKVLVACEESQAVCIEFRRGGHEAYSCDLQDCSGGHPEWHIKADARELLKLKWDLIIAHPPCTYLTSAGSVNTLDKYHRIKDLDRYLKGIEAAEFFMTFYNADCEKIAIENPAPMRIFELPKYTQIIEPYMFGEPWKKRTCLWLRGLPKLIPDEIVEPLGTWVQQDGGPNSTTRTRNDLYMLRGVSGAKNRSKTFPGIANAMARQWGGSKEERKHSEWIQTKMKRKDENEQVSIF